MSTTLFFPKVYSKEQAQSCEEKSLFSRQERLDKVAESLLHFIAQKHSDKEPIFFFIGPKNNGVDGLVAALLLKQEKYNVKIFADKSSCSLHKNYYDQCKKADIPIASLDQNPKLSAQDFIVDALFGTYCTTNLSARFLEIIQQINRSCCKVLSLDIPSGIDPDTGKALPDAVCATWTLCLGLYKTGLFFQDAYNKTGVIHYADLGFIQNNAAYSYLLFPEQCASFFLPTIVKNRHKYDAGLVLGFAGSSSMMGASFLSSKAVLQTGAGVMKTYHAPDVTFFPFAFPEIMVQSWKKNHWKPCLSSAKALFIGPGIGRKKSAAKVVEQVLQSYKGPLVLDADALFFLPKYLHLLPKNAILTPHLKEATRLLSVTIGIQEEQLHQKISSYVVKNGVYLVLKTAPTVVFSPQEKPCILPRGSPGASTAGAGDVLTGIIAGLLAQGCSAYYSACFGVFLHAIASRKAEEKKTAYSLLASDILENIPNAYKEILSTCSSN